MKTHLDKQQDIQDFGLPLAIFLPHHKDVQQAGPYTLAHVSQPALQLGHGVHAALAVLHYLREEQREGAQTHFRPGPGQRALQH